MLFVKYVFSTIGIGLLLGAAGLLIFDLYRIFKLRAPAVALRWRLAMRVAGSGFLALLAGLSITVIPSGQAGVRSASLKGLCHEPYIRAFIGLFRWWIGWSCSTCETTCFPRISRRIQSPKHPLCGSRPRKGSASAWPSRFGSGWILRSSLIFMAICRSRWRKKSFRPWWQAHFATRRRTTPCAKCSPAAAMTSFGPLPGG